MRFKDHRPFYLRSLWGLLFGGAVLVFVITAQFIDILPDGRAVLFNQPLPGFCPLGYLLPHIGCPFCRITRALILLAKGDVAGSINMTVMGFIFVWFWLAYLLSTVFSKYFSRVKENLSLGEFEQCLINVFLIIAIAQWIFLLIGQ